MVVDLAKAVARARRVYLCGNGGSAANAIHIANDLVSVGVRAQALTADIATFSAIANDHSYEDVFARQIAIFGECGDLLIALSGSGRSPNVVRALLLANKMGLDSWAILGAFEDEQPAAVAAGRWTRTGATMQEAEEEQLRIGHEVMLFLREGSR